MNERPSSGAPAGAPAPVVPPATPARVVAPATPAACRHLRTKSMFYDFNRENALSIGPECSTASFWCVKTARGIGPDDEPVHRDLCAAPRACHEA